MVITKRFFDKQKPAPSQDAVTFSDPDWSLNTPANSYQLEVTEQVFLLSETDSTTRTIYLPDIGDAKGLILSFHAILMTGGKYLILQKGSQSLDWDGSTGYDIDATSDGLLLFCDGKIWWVLENRIS